MSTPNNEKGRGGWTRKKVFGFTRYACNGVEVREGHRNIRVKAGWGNPGHHRNERYWIVLDAAAGGKTVGEVEGYLLLRDAKTGGEAYAIKLVQNGVVRCPERYDA